MNRPIEYLGALQSMIKVACDFNQQLKAQPQITQITLAFYLDRESKTRQTTTDLNLVTRATPKEDWAWFEFTLDDPTFDGHTFANIIPAFSDALESALKSCLQALESGVSNPHGWSVNSSEVTIAFILDEQHQVVFTGTSLESENAAIHKITFTLQESIDDEKQKVLHSRI